MIDNIMRYNKVATKKTYTPLEKRKRIKSIAMCAIIVFNMFMLVAKLVYNKFPQGVLWTLDVLYVLSFCLFALEFVLRLISIAKTDGKAGIVKYFKFNKAEPLYMLAMIVIAPLTLIMHGNFIVKMLQWAILLKLPSILRQFNDERVFNIIAKIFLVLLIVFFVFPFLNVIAFAFSKPGRIVNVLPNGIDLFAIKFVLADAELYRAILNSVIITVSGTFISVLIMVLAAYPLSKRESPFRGFMMIFFLIVMLFSGGMATKIMLMDVLGLLDTIWALIFPSVINVFHLLLLKGFFENVPAELEESARLDGANNYHVLFKIIVPISVPMILTVTMFTAIIYWNNFNNALMYIISARELYPLPMFIREFLNRNPMDIALERPELLNYWENIKMAYVMVSILPIACLYPLILKYFTKGVSVGAVKG